MEEHEWIGPYQLLDLIGQGGTAEVHHARHKESEEEVAIKILHEFISNRDPEIQEKFLEQVEISKKLDHSHIVKIIGGLFKETELRRGTRPCIVMPYIPGGTLRKYLNEENLLSLETIRSYAQQLAGALSYAHEHDVIHCDVKPENILLDKDGRNLYLTDFGIARIMSETFSSTNATSQGSSGTDVYMAPEQFTEKGTRRSDQYALAITIYECLCGHPPFVTTTHQKLRQQHLKAPIPSLRKACQARGRRTLKSTEQVILKALAKQKEKRYPNIKAFAEALDKALTEEIEKSQPKLPRSQPKLALKYNGVDMAGTLVSSLVALPFIGTIILFGILTLPIDMPQQFSQGQIFLSNGCELLYGVFTITGISCAVACFVKRRNGTGVIAVGSFLLAIIFFTLQYFFVRPRFTLDGQLELWGALVFLPLLCSYGLGFSVVGIMRLIIWNMNRTR